MRRILVMFNLLMWVMFLKLCYFVKFDQTHSLYEDTFLYMFYFTKMYLQVKKIVKWKSH